MTLSNTPAVIQYKNSGIYYQCTNLAERWLSFNTEVVELDVDESGYFSSEQGDKIKSPGRLSNTLKMISYILFPLSISAFCLKKFSRKNIIEKNNVELLISNNQLSKFSKKCGNHALIKTKLCMHVIESGSLSTLTFENDAFREGFLNYIYTHAGRDYLLEKFSKEDLKGLLIRLVGLENNIVHKEQLLRLGEHLFKETTNFQPFLEAHLASMKFPQGISEKIRVKKLTRKTLELLAQGINDEKKLSKCLQGVFQKARAPELEAQVISTAKKSIKNQEQLALCLGKCCVNPRLRDKFFTNCLNALDSEYHLDFLQTCFDSAENEEVRGWVLHAGECKIPIQEDCKALFRHWYKKIDVIDASKPEGLENRSAIMEGGRFWGDDDHAVFLKECLQADPRKKSALEIVKCAETLRKDLFFSVLTEYAKHHVDYKMTPDFEQRPRSTTYEDKEQIDSTMLLGQFKQKNSQEQVAYLRSLRDDKKKSNRGVVALFIQGVGQEIQRGKSSNHDVLTALVELTQDRSLNINILEYVIQSVGKSDLKAKLINLFQGVNNAKFRIRILQSIQYRLNKKDWQDTLEACSSSNNQDVKKEIERLGKRFERLLNHR